MVNFCRDWSYRLSFNADIVWIRHFEQKLSSEADLLRRYFPMLKYRKADFLPHDPPVRSIYVGIGPIDSVLTQAWSGIVILKNNSSGI